MSLLAFLIPKYTSARGRRVTSSTSIMADFLHDLIFDLTKRKTTRKMDALLL